MWLKLKSSPLTEPPHWTLEPCYILFQGRGVWVATSHHEDPRGRAGHERCMVTHEDLGQEQKNLVGDPDPVFPQPARANSGGCRLSVCPFIVCLLTSSCGFLRLRSWDPCSDHQVLGYQRQAAELRVSVLEVSGGLLGLGWLAWLRSPRYYFWSPRKCRSLGSLSEQNLVACQVFTVAPELDPQELEAPGCSPWSWV